MERLFRHRLPSVPTAAALFLGLLAAGRPAPASDAPTFTYSLSPASIAIEGEPGTTFSRELLIVITTEDNPSDQGIAAWEWSLAAEGLEVEYATVAGTVGALDTEDPPGLRHEPGMEVTQVAAGGTKDCEGRAGAIGTVTLCLTKPVYLPAEGSVAVARIGVTGQVPATLGEVARPRLLFADGCYWSPGSPSDNSITWWPGGSFYPTTSGCDFEVRAVRSPFRRGDANDDGRIDIGDAIAILTCKFMNEACSECRDATDINDDGSIDTSDPIRLLGHLFLGSGPPDPPYPACGIDPEEDAFPTCRSASCAAAP
jgi:hypothetical protein